MRHLASSFKSDSNFFLCVSKSFKGKRVPPGFYQAVFFLKNQKNIGKQYFDSIFLKLNIEIQKLPLYSLSQNHKSWQKKIKKGSQKKDCKLTY